VYCCAKQVLEANSSPKHTTNEKITIIFI
jgi:hypothetical protein